MANPFAEGIKRLCNSVGQQFGKRFNPHVKWVFIAFDDRQPSPDIVFQTNIPKDELRNMLSQCVDKMMTEGNRVTLR